MILNYYDEVKIMIDQRIEQMEKIYDVKNRNKEQQNRAIQLRVFPSPKQNTDYSFFLLLYVNKETLNKC